MYYFNIMLTRRLYRITSACRIKITNDPFIYEIKCFIKDHKPMMVARIEKFSCSNTPLIYEIECLE